MRNIGDDIYRKVLDAIAIEDSIYILNTITSTSGGKKVIEIIESLSDKTRKRII
jgi:hypothetical protein